MRLAHAPIVESERLYGDTCLTWFAATEVARGASPGRFLMLRCCEQVPGQPSCDPLLPRPMSYHRVRQGTDGLEFAVLYDIVGRGTTWLAQRQPGDRVFVWGPLGRGYTIRPRAQNLLLVGGGIGVAPLVWLAEVAVEKGRSVTLLLGGRSAEQIFPARLLPREVELVVTTEDGSLGQRGLVTEPFAEHLPWADQVFACGPNPMFQAMAEVVRSSPVRRPVQVLLEERMGCGAGICYGCAVETRKGMRLVCRDGPRFDLRDVFRG
jgi:dihydroorotate dehydrogenase electron transfer subunit